MKPLSGFTGAFLGRTQALASKLVVITCHFLAAILSPREGYGIETTILCTSADAVEETAIAVSTAPVFTTVAYAKSFLHKAARLKRLEAGFRLPFVTYYAIMQ
ncbi:hypothetical protein VTL71DRAFT_6050 [Oculimacula yallundae]|uniref:Uncharacterized protein n=1 Tax=Oculimacula yallundae TaxID=86028 RepID=A0ABR4C1U1_9HELO